MKICIGWNCCADNLTYVVFVQSVSKKNQHQLGVYFHFYELLKDNIKIGLIEAKSEPY